MKITREQLLSLLVLIGLTVEEEIHCEEALVHLVTYLERSRRRRAHEVDELWVRHLRICAECRAELEAWLVILHRLRL